MAIRTKGTELFLIWINGTSGYQAVKVGCPTGITGLSGAKTQIPTTCLDDTEETFVAGMAQPGKMTVNLDFDTSKISHLDLWDLNLSGTVSTWVIGFTGSTSPPTVNSSTGVVTYPTGRSYISFDGYVDDFPTDFALNSVIKTAMTVQRSGARTLHKATT